MTMPDRSEGAQTIEQGRLAVLPTNNRIVLQWQYNRENNEFVELSAFRYKRK